jgi:hypothetical protein
MRATGLLCAKLENVVMVITFHLPHIPGLDAAPWMGWATPFAPCGLGLIVVRRCRPCFVKDQCRPRFIWQYLVSTCSFALATPAALCV